MDINACMYLWIPVCEWVFVQPGAYKRIHWPQSAIERLFITTAATTMIFDCNIILFWLCVYVCDFVRSHARAVTANGPTDAVNHQRQRTTITHDYVW